MTRSIPVSILGATGYGGQELFRILAGHPRFRVVGAGSRQHAGARVEEAMPHLGGCVGDLRFAPNEEAIPPGTEIVFLATPHGASRTLWGEVAAAHPKVRVIDLSGDFRLRDRAAFDAYYGGEHPHFERTRDFAYGLPETNRAEIARSAHVANPGCFATGALLALAPLAREGLLRGDVVLSQTTGSSGSGAEAKAGTHHPERAQDMRAYKVLGHQHLPEIEQELRRAGADGFALSMVPQSGPFVRGIFTVAHVRLPRKADLPALYRAFAAAEPFVRWREETPALRHVARTNFCDVAVAQKGERAVVLTAIDNLGKGMSGQAVQNANLLCGLEETLGLLVPGANP